ncbi:MAG: hypothetical protein CMJ75_14540 [Planctomycetaceae bacterium]|nr:hypothetical protein [Planctomycetaceae bacterium]
MLFRVCQHVSNAHRTIARVGQLSLGLAMFLSGPHLLWAWQQEVKTDLEPAIAVTAVPLGTAPTETHPTPNATLPPVKTDSGADLESTANEQQQAILRHGLQIAPIAVTITDVRVSTFQDIAPGTTNADELSTKLGQPQQTTTRNDKSVHIFQVGPFPRVEFLLDQDMVIEIAIHLSAPTPAKVIAEQLDIARFIPAAQFDAGGEAVGTIYPERGVRFEFTNGSIDQVERIVLQPIEASPFVDRAEQNDKFDYRLQLADLRYARRLEPANTKAIWLESILLQQMGKYAQSLALSRQAVEITKDPEFGLTYAESLLANEQYQQAIDQARLIAADQDLPPLLRARAEIVLGNATASSPLRNFERAIEHHLLAIRLASQLETNPEISLRREALRILVQAHLACALDVARGNWQRKSDVAPKWLASAREISVRFLQKTHGSPLIELQIHATTLAVAAELDGLLDPTTSLQQMSGRCQTVLNQFDDALHKQQIQWQLAAALFNAARAARSRGNLAQAREWGERATVLFQLGGEHRDPTPARQYLQAKAHYLVGTLYAIPENKHLPATRWYEQAVQQFPKTLPQSASHEIGVHGERLVSMGISFWAIGDPQRALALTESGMAQMEQAVQNGFLPPTAMAVAYRNLAAMHRELGNADMATTFTSKAEQAR